MKPGDDTAIVGDPIGREALMSELAYEMIPYTPEELIAIGNKEYEWCEAEMKRASRELGFGDDWLKALEHVKTLYVEPGKQPDLIRELALEAIEFVDKHDLVTVPQLARDTWRWDDVALTPTWTRSFSARDDSRLLSDEHYDPRSKLIRSAEHKPSRGDGLSQLIPGHHLQASCFG